MPLCSENVDYKAKGVDNPLLPYLKSLFIRAVHKILNLLKFISRFLDAIFDKRRLIVPVAALDNVERQTFISKQAMIEDRHRQFVGAGAMIGPHPILIPSKESD